MFRGYTLSELHRDYYGAAVRAQVAAQHTLRDIASVLFPVRFVFFFLEYLAAVLRQGQGN